MDLSLIKKKLEQLNEQTQDRLDTSGLRWTPANGKQTIRIVPSIENPDNPFTELMFYNKLAKYPILALTNFGEQDPVEEFIQTLRATDDKDNWSLSGKISARPRYFCPVVVRGEEDKGVRIWSISATIYKALLTIAADEEYGDFTDIQKGFDLVVEKTPPATPGAYADITVRAKRNDSPLSEDKAEIKKWLTEQPKVMDLFRKPTYDWLKKQLKAYISGAPAEAEGSGDKKEETAESESKQPEAKKAEPEAKEAEAPKPKSAAKQGKKAVTNKFDDLFKDDDEGGTASTEDDDEKLPWEK